jgi:hypothetical protein
MVNILGSFFGTPSKTHVGRKNYTTKKGDMVYHEKGHYVRKLTSHIVIVKVLCQKLVKEEKILLLKKVVRFIIAMDIMYVNHANHIQNIK